MIKKILVCFCCADPRLTEALSLIEEAKRSDGYTVFIHKSFGGGLAVLENYVFLQQQLETLLAFSPEKVIVLFSGHTSCCHNSTHAICCCEAVAEEDFDEKVLIARHMDARLAGFLEQYHEFATTGIEFRVDVLDTPKQTKGDQAS